MTKGFKTKLKVTAISIAGTLLILYLAGLFLVSYKLNPFLERIVKNGVLNSSDSLYHISYREFTFIITSRTLLVKDVVLKVDTALFSKRKANGKHVPDGLLAIHLDVLKITGIEFFEAIMNSNLEAGNLIIENPEIRYMLYDTLERQDSIVKQPVNFDLYKLFSEQFHSLSIQNILVRNASFRFYENPIDTAAAISSNGIQIEVNRLKIDSAYSANRFEIDLANRIKIEVAEAHWILSDSIYRIQFSNMNLDASHQSLHFEKIEVVPLANKYKISTIKGYEDDLIQMTIDSLALQQLDINLLLYNYSISCRQVEVQNFNLKDFRFKGAPHKPGYRPLPFEQLRAIPLLVRIDSVRILNGRIEYAEQVPDNSFPGIIFFDNITGSIINISNDLFSLAQNPYCTIAANGFVMGKGLLNLKAAFDQSSTVDSFTLDGSLGKMDLTLFNSLIRQSANVRLEKGMIDALDFKIAGTNTNASGRMTFQYHDLALEMILDEKDDKGKMQKVLKKDIVSFLANKFAIVSENPKDNITRNVTMYENRNTEKYIFNYLWKTILSGIKETALTNNAKNVVKDQKK